MSPSSFDAAPDSPIFFDADLRLLRAQIRRFVETEIKPHGDAWEKAGHTPRAVLRRMGELGFLGIRYPEAFGGSALDERASVVLAEELGRSTYGGVAITALVHTDMASVHILNAGTADQHATFLPAAIAGEKITAVAVTEPGAGSDVKGIRTTARREGGAYVLNGAKMFITNGVHGDVYCVAAKTDPAGPPSRSVSMFIVEKGTPGFTVSRALDKHGWRSSDTAELLFDEVRVPAGEPAGAGGARVLRDHEELPERAAGDRRDGDGRGAGGAGADPRLRSAPARPSVRRSGRSRRSASGWRCSPRGSRRRGR